MKVKIIHRNKEAHYFGNILWANRKNKYKMKNGVWLSPHPCAGNPKPLMLEGECYPIADDNLTRFRQLGYYASCFPEGDGISFSPPTDKTATETEQDITNCFGFEIVRAKNWRTLIG